METERKWWKELVVYQVYPRSFKDSNGDGIGDINGMIEGLDYIKSLGITAIWMCPVYESPNDDNGYDVSDYTAIMKEFGTFEDWKRLADGIHERGMKLIMDMVLNHSSSEHEWFKKSRSSKDKTTNPYRDYYFWRPPKQSSNSSTPETTHNASHNDSSILIEPNNWVSFFSGSTWEYDPVTQEFYLHLFSKLQPDLNWENANVRQEICNILDFWCRMGVDGLRMDAINHIAKAEGLPDAEVKYPEVKYQWAGDLFFNGPQVFDWMREIKSKVLNKYDVFTVGETPGISPELGKRYTNSTDGVFDMVFQFEMMGVDNVPGYRWKWQPWQLKDIKDIMSKWQTELDGAGWNSVYLENHDQPRSVSRFGDDSTEELRVVSAKMLAIWLLSLQGTVYIYQGQELGMTNVHFENIQDYRDIKTLNYWKECKELGGVSEEEMFEVIWKKARDNTRTPMPWNDSPNGGFCSGSVEPWFKLNPNYKDINVENAVKDENSVFHFYRKLIALRSKHLTFVYGRYELIAEEHPSVYAFIRTWNDEQLLVVTNWTGEIVKFRLSDDDMRKLRLPTKTELLISNHVESDEDFAKEELNLRPYEARVYLLR